MTLASDEGDHALNIQTLALALYQLGSLLKAQAEQTEVVEALEKVRASAKQLSKIEKLTRLKHMFDLCDAEVQWLLVCYSFAEQPDVFEPFLQMNWYEQGPTASLALLNSLFSSDEQALIETGNLFKWRLCHHQSEPLAYIQAVYLAEDVRSWLKQLQPTEISIPTLRVYKTTHNKAVSVCYEQALKHASARLVWMAGQDENEKLGVILNAVYAQSGAYCCVFDPFTAENVSPSMLIDSLRTARLKLEHQSFELYWPNALEISQQHPEYWPCLALINQLPACRFWLDHSPLRVNFRARQYLCRFFPDPSGQTEVQLTPPGKALLTEAWYQQTYEQFHDLCGSPELTVSQAQQLANLYPLLPMGITQVIDTVKLKQVNRFEPRSLFKALQAECLVAISEQTDELASLKSTRRGLTAMVLAEKTQEQVKEVIARIELAHRLQSHLAHFQPGVQALFWGKPGTGKSLAAEAIAHTLNLPLYQVNLSNVASKWIGETEKHLAKLFDSAERQNAVLLFDEADAIFAKRSEVDSSQDKNANMGVSFLLQRMESYSGLLLLSSNFKSNLDEAFLRRFHAVIEFPMPDKNLRKRLWQTAWYGAMQPEPSLDLEALAENFEFSPAQIHNIAERALMYALAKNAHNINKHHLAQSIYRELDKHNAGFLAEQKVARWLSEAA